MGNEYNEDNLVEASTIEILESLGWETETAWHNESMGKDGLLGREKKSEVILQKFLFPMLQELNPNLPPKAYSEAYEQIAKRSSDKSVGQINQEQYTLLREGVPVSPYAST